MGNVFTFYSVGKEQFVQFLSDMESNKAKVSLDDPKETDGNIVGTVEGNTPVGEVASEVVYSPLSGQLTVTVTKKPFLVGYADIEHHVRLGLANARANAEKKAQQKPAPETKPAPPAATEQKPKSEPQPPVQSPEPA